MYLFRPLEAYPAHRCSFCIADEGESVVPPVLGELIRRGTRPRGSVRSLLRPDSVLCGRGAPVSEPVGSYGIVVIRGKRADSGRLSAHGVCRSLWPEQKHLEVTEENATAALQHAVTAQHPRTGRTETVRDQLARVYRLPLSLRRMHDNHGNPERLQHATPENLSGALKSQPALSSLHFWNLA